MTAPSDLRHYASAPVAAIRPGVQINPATAELIPEFRPQGLWLSVGSAWADWCRRERFLLETLALCYRVILEPSANVLVISTTEHLRKFTLRYLAPDLIPTRVKKHIDWRIVAADYQGIIVDPYIDRADDPWISVDCLWYIWGWDSAGGVVWDTSAIKSFVLVEPASVQSI